MKKIKIDQKDFQYESKLLSEAIEIKFEGQTYTFKLNDLRGDIFSSRQDFWYVDGNRSYFLEKVNKKRQQANDHGLTSPMPGKILKVFVTVGQKVEEGESLLILEAMKMEHTIKAPSKGVVTGLPFKVGDQVSTGTELIVIEGPTST